MLIPSAFNSALIGPLVDIAVLDVLGGIGDKFPSNESLEHLIMLTGHAGVTVYGSTKDDKLATLGVRIGSLGALIVNS